MSSTAQEPEEAEEAINEEEMTSTVIPATKSTSLAKPRNAFSELMAPKPAAPSKPPSTIQKIFKDRDGLGAYINSPESFPRSRVIYSTENFVAIHDLYPKASVHALLLPRSPDRYFQHPLDALSDPKFLEPVIKEAERLKKIMAAELQRLFSKESKQDKARLAVLQGETVVNREEDLPAGRDWMAELRIGVHAIPSMRHLHVHVLSQDMHSECMKKRNHYNSFNSPFFVELDSFPLAADDPRRRAREEGYMRRDFKCWRCGKGFKNHFKELKEHLEVEFEEWKAE